MREVKKDADELVEDAEFEVGDSAYKMRKVMSFSFRSQLSQPYPMP